MSRRFLGFPPNALWCQLLSLSLSRLRSLSLASGERSPGILYPPPDTPALLRLLLGLEAPPHSRELSALTGAWGEDQAGPHPLLLEGVPSK